MSHATALVRCLIVDEVHPALMQILEEKGVDVAYSPLFTRQEVELAFGSFDVLVVRSKFALDADFVDRASNCGLKIIARAGAGLDTIDIAAAERAGVAVLHAAEGNKDAVAEHSVGLILTGLNRFSQANTSVKGRLWLRESFRGTELKNKTVGLLGYGNMGRATAACLTGFGCRVIAYDKYLTDWPDENALQVSLPKLQAQSDIVSIHLPLSSETIDFVNASFLEKCRKGLVLINTARGPIVSLQELCDALDTGAVGFAALDVLPVEPPPKKDEKNSSIYERLFQFDNVVCTPHVAGWSLESYEKISTVLAHKIIHQIGLLKN